MKAIGKNSVILIWESPVVVEGDLVMATTTTIYMSVFFPLLYVKKLFK